MFFFNTHALILIFNPVKMQFIKSYSEYKKLQLSVEWKSCQILFPLLTWSKCAPLVWMWLISEVTNYTQTPVKTPTIIERDWLISDKVQLFYQGFNYMFLVVSHGKSHGPQRPSWALLYQSRCYKIIPKPLGHHQVEEIWHNKELEPNSLKLINRWGYNHGPGGISSTYWLCNVIFMTANSHILPILALVGWVQMEALFFKSRKTLKLG